MPQSRHIKLITGSLEVMLDSLRDSMPTSGSILGSINLGAFRNRKSRGILGLISQSLCKKP